MGSFPERPVIELVYVIGWYSSLKNIVRKYHSDFNLILNVFQILLTTASIKRNLEILKQQINLLTSACLRFVKSSSLNMFLRKYGLLIKRTCKVKMAGYHGQVFFLYVYGLRGGVPIFKKYQLIRGGC